MPHEPGHIEMNNEPQVKIQPPEQEQVEQLLKSSDDIGSSLVITDNKSDPDISFQELLQKEIGNLDFESSQFWSSLDEKQDYKDFIPIFNSKKPIGYDNINGGKPIFLDNVLENASNSEKLEYIYNTITYNRDSIGETKDLDSVRNKRDNEGKSWAVTKDNKVIEIDYTKEDEIGTFKNILGTFVPGIDSRKELRNRRLYEAQLSDLGLTPEKAEELRDQLKEAHWYMKDGKLQYNEETKDLSYLIPDVNDYSFEFQARQMFGNLADDFPSLVLSGYAFLSKEYQTSGMAPNKKLLDPEKNLNIFGMDVTALREGKIEFPQGNDLLKTDEDYLDDVEQYANQKAIELAFVEELVGNFDEKKQTKYLWAPFKNLHKNIVYNNTSFEMTSEMIKMFENPTDSFMYHATDVITEGLPYIAVLNGMGIAYGIQGTTAYNGAVDYVLANTGKGLKHADPIKAMNYYLKNYVTNEKLKKNPSKFIQKTVRRLDERQASKVGMKQIKANLQKEIDTVGKQIDDAVANGDTALIEKLRTAQDSLIRNQLGLKPKYFLTKADKSLVSNETVAAIFGGVGRDIFGDGLYAAGFEIFGAFAEPFILKQGVKGVARSTALHTARVLDSISIIPGSPQIRDYLLGQSLQLNVQDIIINDAITGLPRKLNVSETRSIKKFINVVEGMPSEQRLDILASMNAADESLKVLLKDMPAEQQDLVKFTLSQYTGLAALQAVAEMYNIKKLNTSFTSGDLVTINNQMAESQNLITVINNSMSTLLEKNPNNPQVQNFASKINENIKLINEDLDAKAIEFDSALEAMVDLEKGLNLFDNPDALNKNVRNMVEMLENIKENGFSESAQATANNLLQAFDERLLDDLKNIADELGTDGSNYKTNGMADIVFAFKQADKISYKKLYSKLYDLDKNIKLDFTEYFDDMMGGIFPQGRFGSLKEPTGIISNKLPSNSETAKFVNVVQEATTRSTIDWMTGFGNRKAVLEAWNRVNKTGEGTDLTEILLQNRNLTGEESIRLFEGFQKQIKKNNPNFIDIPESAVTGIDIRDMFLGLNTSSSLAKDEFVINIPITMNLKEAMEFKSGIGSFAYSAVEKLQPKSRTFMEMYNQVNGVLETTLNNSGNDELVQTFVDATNAYTNYINKWNGDRFTDLKKWTKVSDTGTHLKTSQNANADSTKVLEKVKPVNEDATDLYKQVTGDPDGNVARFTTATNPDNWIDYGRLLYDEKYASDFMKNVVAPLVGKRDASKVISGSQDDIGYIIDLSDPQTVKKLEIVRGFLQDGLGNWFRRTPQGQLVLGENATKKILQEDKINNVSSTTKLDINKKIKLDDNSSTWFKITGADGKEINILNIDTVANTNLAFDNLLARNTYIGSLALQNNKTFATVFKKAKINTKKQLKEYKYAKTQLGGNAILYNFGQSLTESDVFVKQIIQGNGDLTNYNKLKEVIVGTGEGKISAEQFDTITKELFADYFYKTFSRPARGKDIISTAGEKPIKDLDVTDSFFDNALGAKAFLKQNNKNLVGVFGQKHIDDMNAILNIVLIKSGVDTGDINKAKLPQSLSVESLISRLYSINRGIISPKYVATEVSLQRFRKSKAHMMEELIKSPELAGVVRKVLESDNIYQDTFTNATLQQFLNDSVIKAILLRETAEFTEEELESNQTEMLNELNQELQNATVRDRL